MQKHYIHFSSLPSTNTWAKEHHEQLDPQALTCLTATEQTAGRGRMHRPWLSPAGLNLYLTLYFTLPDPFPYLANLSQILSISCCKALETLGFSPLLKWPNDLLLEGKKVAGVLCETVPLTHRVGIVLGIGVNVNMGVDLLQTLSQPATSLQVVGSRSFPIPLIQASIIDCFEQDLAVLQQGGFPPFHAYYAARFSLKDVPCIWINGTQSLPVLCRGVSPEGTLLATFPSGETKTIVSGELTRQKSSDQVSPGSVDGP